MKPDPIANVPRAKLRLLWARFTRTASFKTIRIGGGSSVIPKILVDTGSETWIPEGTLERIGVARKKKDLPFIMANDQQITRSVGFAIIRIGEHFTTDEVFFAEKGDLLLLGARALEGLNLVVNSRDKKLVAADPIPAA